VFLGLLVKWYVRTDWIVIYYHRRILWSIAFSRTVSHVERAIKFASLATRIIPSRVLAVFHAATLLCRRRLICTGGEKGPKRYFLLSPHGTVYKGRRELSRMDYMRLEYHQRSSWL